MEAAKLTLLDAILESIKRAAMYVTGDTAPPVCILWTDESREWTPLIPRLRDFGLPLVSYGDYDPAAKTGPAIWIRCMISRTLPDADWAPDMVPIVYLPGISRHNLRAVEESPEAYKPIAELQYRGRFWSHENGRDWSIAGFLQSERVGIAVASDNATREAMERALLLLVDEPIESLRAGAPLTASKFNSLFTPDPARNLLMWISDPVGRKKAVSGAEWDAFRGICRSDFGFDPDADGVLVAAQRLGSREGAWKSVWNRFAEAPARYPGIPSALRQAKPRSVDLFVEPSSWPQDNEAAEDEVREALTALAGHTVAEAKASVARLEKAQGARRQWVWAELGNAPLAKALSSLSSLAAFVEYPLSGAEVEQIAKQYAGSGWRTDAAVLDALAAVDNADDVKAVKVAIDTLYRPWLTVSAENFQLAVRNQPPPRQAGVCEGDSPAKGRCILFADGLRMDVGKRIVDALRAKHASIDEKYRFAAVPSVTPTAKPAVSPVANLCGAGNDFTPNLLADNSKVTIETLRRELKRIGYQVLQGDEMGDPTGAAWTEFGNLDSYGHDQGWKLARRVKEETLGMADRILSLLDTGWKEVVIVTDHGWLLVPGGLPKSDLPEHLTEIRKGRCARLKTTATAVAHQIAPWHWDSSVSIAMAPGITCYTAGREYEHGGLSAQECVVPVITVRQTSAPVSVSIAEVKWKGLRCQVTVKNATVETRVDVRTKAADGSSSLAAAVKPLSGDGAVSIAIADDSNIGLAAFVVVLGSDGQILAQRPTAIGGDSE